jgi:hypothetical protein
MATAGELKFVITVDSSGAVKNINVVGDSTEKLEKKTQKANKSFISQAKHLAAISGAAIIAKKAYDFISESIDVASAALEEHSKLNAIFSEQAEAVAIAVSTLTDNYGQSTLSAEKMLAATGDLLTGLGTSQEEALKLSLQTQQLAVDLASFTNFSGGATGASEALTKAMLGEREMIKSLGISILEADVQQRLLEKGQQALSGTALKTAKAHATLELAMEQSKNAMGDFARTQDSFANQSRQLENTIEDLKVEIGKAFIKILLPFLKDFASWIRDNKDSILAFFEGLGKAIKGVADAFDFASKFGKNFMEALSNIGEGNEELAKQTKFTAEETKNINAAFAEMIEEHEAAVSGTKKLYKEVETLTKDLDKQEVALTETQKIMQRYGVSLQSANEILKAQHPELDEIEKLQKSLNIDTKEATKLYGVLNKLEKEREGTLKETNVIIPDTIKFNDDLSESLQDIFNEMDAANQKQEELAAGLEGEANRAIENTTIESAGLTDELIKQQQEWENLKLGVREFVNIAAGALDAFTSIASRAGKSGEKIAQWGDILGGAVNSILRGDFLGATLSLAGNMDKLAKALWGTAESTDLLNEKIEQAKELLADIPGVSDQAAYNLGLFLDQVERGVYELDQFNEFMQDMSQVQPEDWPISNWSGPFTGIDPDELQENLDAYNQLLQDVAGTDPGAIGAAMEKALGGLNDFLAQGARGQMEFNDQVNLTLGTFANLMKSGLSITETLGMMGDSFDQLIATQQQGQFEGNALFEELSKFRTLIKDNEDLVKSVEGFNTLLGATAELGEISQEQLSSFAREAGREFEKLTEAGFSQNQALQMLGPSLKTLEENAAAYGHKIDKNTQSLIDQAREAGVFDEMADPMDTLLQVMMKIGEVLGADMSEFNNLGKAAAAGASEATNSFEEVNVAIQKIGDTALDTAGVMAKSMDIATESMTGNIMNLENESLKAFNNMAADAAAAAREMKGSFSGLGGNNNNLRIQPPVLPLNRNVPGFATGGGGIVPPGFNNDDFHIGLSSGEPFMVGSTNNTTTNNRTDNMSITLNQQITGNDTVDSITLGFIEALKEKRYGIDKEIKKAIGA